MACRLDGKQAYDGRPLCKELTEAGREEKERWVTFPGKLARIAANTEVAFQPPGEQQQAQVIAYILHIAYRSPILSYPSSRFSFVHDRSVVTERAWLNQIQVVRSATNRGNTMAPRHLRKYSVHLTVCV